MSEVGMLEMAASEAVSRRRFLRGAAITASAVPVIMTLSTSGAKAATCSSATNRDDGCTCTVNTQCTAPSTCNDVGGTLKCCTANGVQMRTGLVCTGQQGQNPGTNASCCSGKCNKVQGKLTCVA